MLTGGSWGYTAPMGRVACLALGGLEGLQEEEEGRRSKTSSLAEPRKGYFLKMDF